MKKIRPISLTIASILMVVVMLAGFALPTLFPRLGFAGAEGRFQADGTGNAAGGQNFNRGTLPEGAAPRGGGDFGNGPRAGGGQGGFGRRQFGGANPLGAVSNANSTTGLVIIGLQTGMSILRILFAGLGLLAALGLFQMKRWGRALSVILLVFSVIGFFLPQNTLLRLMMPMIGFGGANAAANSGLASIFSFNLLRLNWVNLIEPVGLLGVTILAFLPASRKAMAPITDEDLLADEEAPESVEAQPAETTTSTNSPSEPDGANTSPA